VGAEGRESVGERTAGAAPGSGLMEAGRLAAPER
jgi:hypothetical protein